MIVPALVLAGGLAMPLAVGTSLVVIAINSAAGFVGHLGEQAMPWGYAAAFTGVCVGGGPRRRAARAERSGGAAAESSARS